MNLPPLSAADFREPAVRLRGAVDDAMYDSFRRQFDGLAKDTRLLMIELSTLGGDPEVARMMGEDIRYETAMQPDRRLAFLGKAAIYSAGTTFMSFFVAAESLCDAGHPSHDS